jgi:hypothetical protein
VESERRCGEGGQAGGGAKTSERERRCAETEADD